MLKAGLDGHQWSRLRALLLQKKILMSTANNRYVFTHDPAKMTLWDLNSLLDDGIFSPLSDRGGEILEKYPWSGDLLARLNTVNDQAGGQFSLSLQELFDA